MAYESIKYITEKYQFLYVSAIECEPAVIFILLFVMFAVIFVFLYMSEKGKNENNHCRERSEKNAATKQTLSKLRSTLLEAVAANQEHEQGISDELRNHAEAELAKTMPR